MRDRSPARRFNRNQRTGTIITGYRAAVFSAAPAESHNNVRRQNLLIGAGSANDRDSHADVKIITTDQGRFLLAAFMQPD